MPEPSPEAPETTGSPESWERLRLQSAVRWRRHYATTPPTRPGMISAGLDGILEAGRLSPETAAELEGHRDALRALLRPVSASRKENA